MSFIRKLRIATEVFVLFWIDFVVAVFNILFWLCRKQDRLSPAIVKMPLRLENSFGRWIFSLIIFLVPGSLVVDISADQKIWYVHIFHAINPDDFIKKLKQRFESRLLQLFSEDGRSL